VNRASRVAALVNAAWMTFVWATRINNAVGDATLSRSGAVLAYSLSAVGIASAAVLVVAAWKGVAVGAVVPLAAVQIVVWVVRGATIAFGSRAVGFKVVHVVLAVISVSLASWLIGEMRRGDVAAVV